MFSDFKEQVVIEIIAGNNSAQNQLLAKLYEQQHDQSLATAPIPSPGSYSVNEATKRWRRPV